MSASNAIAQLNSSIEGFEAPVTTNVNNVKKSTEHMRVTTREIYEKIETFKNDLMKGEEKQIAHERLLQIDQILKENFSNHEEIRRTVIGVVRDFDINLVRNSTIQELSEELWITSSRYWLSYALIAITAWVNDYPDVARNALAEAGRKDAVKSTLFFCLLNLRFDRLDVAKRWFKEYLNTLDPTMLEKETSVMLQSYFNGIFGKDKELEYSVTQIIDEWIAIINSSEEICDSLVDAYKNYIQNRPVEIDFDYSALKEFCRNTDAMRQSITDVAKYDGIFKLLNSLKGDEVEQSDNNYKERVDAVMINLITNYDQEELEIRKEKRKYELIVTHKGDVESAEKELKEIEEKEACTNIGVKLLNWAIYSEDEDLQVRKFGFKNTKNWLQDALERYEGEILQRYPAEYELNIDGWSGITNGADQKDQAEAMKNYYENNKFQNMYVNTLNIVCLAVFIVSIGLAFVTPYSLVASVISLGILAYRVVKAMKEYPARVNAGLENLASCMAEIAQFQQQFKNGKEKKNELIKQIEFDFN
ncbi:MAG: hypothetical protein PUG60_07355 [Lachnospiraceae bacterium]|nr:hypothetical protein [Lachnospiraceae bacterium]